MDNVPFPTSSTAGKEICSGASNGQNRLYSLSKQNSHPVLSFLRLIIHDFSLVLSMRLLALIRLQSLNEKQSAYIFSLHGYSCLFTVINWSHGISLFSKGMSGIFSHEKTNIH